MSRILDRFTHTCGRIASSAAWPVRQPWFPPYVMGMATMVLAACLFVLSGILGEILGYP